jgi:hypothetical protein
MLQAYGGLGRALPINRGAGVNQKLLLDFARLIAAGEMFVVWSCVGCACSYFALHKSTFERDIVNNVGSRAHFAAVMSL